MRYSPINSSRSDPGRGTAPPPVICRGGVEDRPKSAHHGRFSPKRLNDDPTLPGERATASCRRRSRTRPGKPMPQRIHTPAAASGSGASALCSGLRSAGSRGAGVRGPVGPLARSPEAVEHLSVTARQGGARCRAAAHPPRPARRVKCPMAQRPSLPSTWHSANTGTAHSSVGPIAVHSRDRLPTTSLSNGSDANGGRKSPAIHGDPA